MENNLTENTAKTSLKIRFDDECMLLLREEAEKLDISLNKLIHDYTLSHLRMRQEAALAYEGNLEHATSAYTQLLNIDARLDQRLQKLENLIREADDKGRTLVNLFAVFMEVWLNHTEPVPEHMREERRKLTKLRMERFIKQVAKEERNLEMFAPAPLQYKIQEALELLVAEEGAAHAK